FVTNAGAKLGFWNLEEVLRSNSETVFIVEGEFDVLTLVEARSPSGQVLSVPNGTAESADGGYVDAALAAGLNQVKRFVWCGDADDVGLKLRADMMHRLGPA